MVMIILNIAILVLIIMNNKESISSNINENQLPKESNIAIMVYDEELGGYVKQDTIPKYYRINADKTHCVAGSTIGDYDPTKGTVIYHLISADHCYLFFDKNKVVYESNGGDSPIYDNVYVVNPIKIINKMEDGSAVTFVVLLKQREDDTYQEFARETTNNQKLEIYRTDLLSFFGKNNGAYTYTNVRIMALASDGTIIDTFDDEKIYHSYCFVAGTKVLTLDGYKNIENIKIGELVYSYNFTNNKIELKPVTNTINSKSNLIVEVTIENETIKMSNRHEVYVLDKGWVRAYDLKKGDILINKQGEQLPIKSIREIYYENAINTYNLTILDNHNYYVSENNINMTLVHNAGSIEIE